MSDRQVQIPIRSLAVPIRSKLGRVEAALNASAYETRTSRRDMLQRFLPALLRAAAQLSQIQ